jgi:hypothetical protein
MGRVLGLVAAALVAMIALLSLAVYLTRDEDNLQVDNLLAERFTRAVGLADRGDGTVDLRQVAAFDWDRVLIVAPDTPRAAISRRLGQEWTGVDTVDGGDILIFRLADEVVRFADYRGNGRFEGFPRPFAELPRERAVLEVRSLAIRPRS